MRQALAHARGGRDTDLTAHPGLLYERYVPLIYGDRPGEVADKRGTVRPEDRERLLRELVGIPVSPVYRAGWRRWYAAMSASAVTRVVEANGRLLIGHGNPAPTEVGITLHQVYGVPVLPGAALKGVLNHYLAEWGGAEDARWRGVGYDDKGRPREVPGDWHRAIFGAPPVPLPDGTTTPGSRGGVIFQDAWLIPRDDQPPLSVDVLTPHQGDYYRKFGEAPPDDWTEPNPVTFLTVTPGSRFLLAISPVGKDRQAAELAMDHLLDALREFGIGAKTRAGFGRLRLVDQASAPTRESLAPDAAPGPASEQLQALEAAVDAVLDPPDRDNAPPIAQRLNMFITDELLASIPAADRRAAARILKRLSDNRGLSKRQPERLKEIMQRLES